MKRGGENLHSSRFDDTLRKAATIMREPDSMNEIRQKVRGAVCGICFSEDHIELYKTKSIYDNESYTIFWCPNCNNAFTSPPPSPDLLISLYSTGNYRSMDGDRFNRYVEHFVRYFSILKKHNINKYRPTTGALLDVGCGRGLFLDIMRKDGWSVTGVEFNEETARNAASKYGVKVVSVEAMTGFKDESFDVVTLYHVLEHMRDPSAVLQECRRLLKKQGLLVIAVPMFDSLQASLGKALWFHLDVPYHLFHFTLRGLRSLLVANSLHVVNVCHFDFEQNTFGWLQTLLNISGIKKNLLYDLLKKRELNGRQSKKTRRRDILWTVVLLPIYVPLSVLLSIYESIVKRGATLSVYSIKK